MTLGLILRAVGMSSSSYHDANKRRYQQDSEQLIDTLKLLRKEHEDYGYRTMTLALRNMGYTVNHKKVLRLMTKYDLLCHAFERKTRKYNSYRGSVGNIETNRLNRRFKTDRPYQKIVTDVTELRWGNKTTDERAYFTAYMDLFSGEIISWAIGLHPTVQFVTNPLDELLAHRPELSYRMTIHSDQGFQYQNWEYRNRLKEAKVFQSMSRKATCLDNAAAESFFHILKVGTVHNHVYANFEELRTATTAFIDYYNHKRIKTKLAGMTPVGFRKHSSQFVA
ncbi:IS3 family transposase [Lacticaseibacillus nasuensis]|uniref:IS3 family transposase n=1 Tax=Lacticaseibacillus nasuensis TaxID=944671 RepID=UPI002246E197|nr:IS3 family transposase [Lacticaseibacillus nasuensis]MCX2456572.1 IS3 family transposase [Lacticaseibacillus nasuensis]